MKGISKDSLNSAGDDRKMKKISVKTFAILVGIILFSSVLTAGCGSGGGSGVTLPAASAPRVLSLAPADGASGVATSTTMIATFDMPMDMSSVNSRMHLYEGTQATGTMVGGTFSWNDAQTAMTFTPNMALTPGATHTIHFSSGMR